ncbi:MAG: hypothetical protein A2219_04790 [Elusimicrobia bacterium RIFOXYA2_FULL_50_26]|nr:MAG: hypothetical protein A2219_04790 [Elusimicrobia bacterium RIFOXYA2_FULL_50_26]OGS23357.1 MAG: hypothetical protein A2314_08105 [Elusimicrobia bacterium RIFOXYB2_FULL_50_12]
MNPVYVITSGIDAGLPDTQFMKTLAEDTWGYMRDIVDRETGLPLDNIIMVSTSPAQINDYTSITNIGLYLMCVTAADSMGLIQRADALGRIRLVIDSLSRMDTWEGQFYNYYKTDDLSHSGHYVSTVDLGWLAAGIVVVKNAFPSEFGDDAQALLDQIDFSKFYDTQLGHLALGYDAQSQKMSPYHYGLLCTEPRVASYLAIAKGDVPETHWLRLYRTLPRSWHWQKQIPLGKSRRYGRYGVFNGYYVHNNFRYVPSWGGSMFEFLMPTLVLKEQELAHSGLGANNKAVVGAQIAYALDEAGYPVWGISPCSIPSDPEGYREYGVDFLGSKGYDDKGVIAPYASILALDIEPRKTVENLRKLSEYTDIYGPYGFFDSINVLTGQVNTKYLCLDQAMSFLALANYLTGGGIREWFHSDPSIKEYEHLLSDERFF